MSSSQPIVGLIVGSISFTTSEYDELRKKHRIEFSKSKTREEFFHDCQGKYKDVIAIHLSYSAVQVIGKFDKEFVDHLPESVKFICYNAAGYDLLDVDACTARNIYVSHTPGAVDAGTADIAATLILNTCRNASQFERNLREGRWRHGISMGMDLENKTLGILGMGGIGKAVAKRMYGFDMKIQYNNRNRLPAEVEEKYHARYVDFETLLKTSDVLFVSVPLSKSTYHLIGGPEFSIMKDGIIIVNTARGAVIHEAELVSALATGKVLAAGLDVFENEPQIHPGLLSHPRSVLYPHIGTHTKESAYKMELVVVKNMEAALSNNTLLTPIPEHKKFFQ